MPNSLMDSMNNAQGAEPNPAAGGVAPPGGGQQQPQVALQDVKDAIKKQSTIDHSLRMLLAGGKPIPRKDAVQLCVKLVADRVFSAEEMAGYLTTLPTDPMQVRDWVAKHAQNAEMNLDKLLQMIEGEEAMPAAPPAMVPGGPVGQ